jgi:hypothetical protein
MVSVVALLVVQARVLNWPAVMVAGVAVNVADGADGAGVGVGPGVGVGLGVGFGVGLGDAAKPVPAQPDEPATKIPIKRNARTITA